MARTSQHGGKALSGTIFGIILIVLGAYWHSHYGPLSNVCNEAESFGAHVPAKCAVATTISPFTAPMIWIGVFMLASGVLLGIVTLIEEMSEPSDAARKESVRARSSTTRSAPSKPILARDFGAIFAHVHDGASGVAVQSVTERSPAGRIGILAGDVITAFDAQSVKDAASAESYLAGRDPSTALSVTWVREGHTHQEQVLVGTRAPDPGERRARLDHRSTARNALSRELTAGRFGVLFAPGDRASGATVQCVAEPSPAARIGVTAGDTIAAFDGQSIDDPASAEGYLESRNSSTALRVIWIHEGHTREEQVRV